MKKIKNYQVDAFTDKLFSGNPAGVCFLEEWLSDDLMQSIGMENNLAETAFVVPEGDHYMIRWFTPTVEVDLCGHATLASAYILFTKEGYSKKEIVFHSPRSGELKVSKQGETLFLNFPTDTITESDCYLTIKNCIGIEPIEIFKGKTDFIAIVESEKVLTELSVNLNEISKLEARGLIVTAKGDEVDFVSRFFAPQSGIDEDPVTGSAHTSLIPIWSKKLNKKEMTAKQLSKRSGELLCINMDNRCLIGGKAKLFMIGEIILE